MARAMMQDDEQDGFDMGGDGFDMVQPGPPPPPPQGPMARQARQPTGNQLADSLRRMQAGAGQAPPNAPPPNAMQPMQKPMPDRGDGLALGVGGYPGMPGGGPMQQLMPQAGGFPGATVGGGPIPGLLPPGGGGGYLMPEMPMVDTRQGMPGGAPSMLGGSLGDVMGGPAPMPPAMDPRQRAMPGGMGRPVPPQQNRFLRAMGRR